MFPAGHPRPAALPIADMSRHQALFAPCRPGPRSGICVTESLTRDMSNERLHLASPLPMPFCAVGSSRGATPVPTPISAHSPRAVTPAAALPISASNRAP